ncbi:MAG: thymidylate synthase [Pseudomonadales bacterium]|nr:thymidylate synthase [Pseudomonadales bacterium]
MKHYLQQLQLILDQGAQRTDRTGVGTLSIFGMQCRYDLAAGFPAVTTKKLVWKSMLSELLWFISGSGNINDLKKIYPHNRLWDLNYEDYVARNQAANNGATDGTTNEGDMGRVYGQQWRHWQTAQGQQIDQLAAAIALIKHNPDSRRIIVNAWNPGEVSATDVALPPCHSFFQFYVANGKLSLQMYQRSADMFLGVPLNIASYSLLLHMIAKITGLIPGEFIHSIGDAHIYLDAIDQCKQQLSRQPLPLARLQIADRGQSSIDDFVMQDFQLIDYQSHSAIKANMAV